MTNFEKLVLLDKLLTELEVNPEDLYAFAKAAEVLDRGWEPEDGPGKVLGGRPTRRARGARVNAQARCKSSDLPLTKGLRALFLLPFSSAHGENRLLQSTRP